MRSGPESSVPRAWPTFGLLHPFQPAMAITRRSAPPVMRRCRGAERTDSFGPRAAVALIFGSCRPVRTPRTIVGAGRNHSFAKMRLKFPARCGRCN
jgi:hypothetical protein